MSMQVGILQFDGAPADRETLFRMSAHFSDFAPDGQSSYFQNSIGMLYRPFHTTPESRLELQPFISKCGLIVTWDGRLDNRDELIRELGGSLREDTDVSIVAAGVDQWGARTFSKIVGDWALAIWNPREEVLLLARDFAGIRPLYYWQQASSIIWSSNLASLVSCGRNFTLSNDYVAGYLTMWPDSDLTPYKEIKSVPAGHFIHVSRGKVIRNFYWKFNPHSTIRYASDAQYEEHFRFLFRQSVRRRLRTDCRVLAELSGGLDSSAIVCMADNTIAKGEVGATTLDTFSYCDRAEPDEEDFLYFTKVEEQRGRAGHHAQLYGCGDSFRLGYEDFVATPGFGARQEIQSALAEVVCRYNYGVILSGTGGDELLGQTFDPRVHMADLLVQGRLGAFWKQITAWSVLMRRPWYRLSWETITLLLPPATQVILLGERKQLPWIGENFFRRQKLAPRLLQAVEGHWDWLPSQRDSLQTLTTLTRQATYAKPFSAERRYPYLDQDLVEFLLHIPVEQLVRPGDRRSLMRRSLKTIVPQEILARRTKSAEGRCYVVTLDKHWIEIESMLESSVISELGYIEPAEFREALAAMRRGTLSPHYVRLLRALSLEIWLREMIARDVISGRAPSAPCSSEAKDPSKKTDRSFSKTMSSV